MTDKADKSNAEVAAQIARALYYAEPYPHDEVSTVPKTAPIIESALATAQSQLAREVLRELNRDLATVNHDVGAHDLEECATCAAATETIESVRLVRNLLTRLGIEVEKE